MIAPDDLDARAATLLAACREAGLTIATAESCTGGLVAGVLTGIPGSSAVFERGFVTYSNAAKTELLGVEPDTLEVNGAVSEAVARAMARGALATSHADIAVSVTGVAGPGGGTDDKPVGLVNFGAARRDGDTRHREVRFGDRGRRQIRLESVGVALEMLREAVGLSV